LCSFVYHWIIITISRRNGLTNTFKFCFINLAVHLSLPILIYSLTSLVLLVFCCYANANQLSGIVLDSESKEPLPYAHIVAGENRNVTNLDGRFTIKLIENHVDSVSISFIGYQTKRIPFSAQDLFLTIELTPSVKQLETVVISGNFGEQLVKRSMNRVFTNYSMSRLKLRGYYKESMKRSGNLGYLAEGIVDVFVPLDYQRATQIPQVLPVQTRRKIIDSLDFDLVTGHASDMAHSSLWRKGSFLNNDQLKNYEFIYDGYQNLENQGVYIVNFEPKNWRGVAQGRIYIDEETYAILKLEYEMLTSDSPDWDQVVWVEEYQMLGGIFELFRVSYKGTYLQDQEYTAELIIHQSESIPAIPSANFYDEQAAFFNEASDNFDNTFWGDYNFMELDDQEKLSVE